MDDIRAAGGAASRSGRVAGIVQVAGTGKAGLDADIAVDERIA